MQVSSHNVVRLLYLMPTSSIFYRNAASSQPLSITLYHEHKQNTKNTEPY